MSSLLIHEKTIVVTFRNTKSDNKNPCDQILNEKSAFSPATVFFEFTYLPISPFPFLPSHLSLPIPAFPSLPSLPIPPFPSHPIQVVRTLYNYNSKLKPNTKVIFLFHSLVGLTSLTIHNYFSVISILGPLRWSGGHQRKI